MVKRSKKKVKGKGRRESNSKNKLSKIKKIKKWLASRKKGGKKTAGKKMKNYSKKARRR